MAAAGNPSKPCPQAFEGVVDGAICNALPQSETKNAPSFRRPSWRSLASTYRFNSTSAVNVERY